MSFTEGGCEKVNWIELALGGFYWWAVVLVSHWLCSFYLPYLLVQWRTNMEQFLVFVCFGFCLICSFCFVIVRCLFHHLKNLTQKVMCKIYIAECSITIFILPLFNTAYESCPGCHIYHCYCFLCEVCTEAGKRVEHQFKQINQPDATVLQVYYLTFCVAQHVSGASTPIIRSLQLH